MTICFTRYVPVSRGDLMHGIKRMKLNDEWTIVTAKYHNPKDIDNDEDMDVVIKHNKTKVVSPKRTLFFKKVYDDDYDDQIEIKSVCINHAMIDTTVCNVCIKGSNKFEALLKALEKPSFTIDLFNLKTRGDEYDYLTKKFGNIFVRERA